jgi:hypothetical protein
MDPILVLQSKSQSQPAPAANLFPTASTHPFCSVSASPAAKYPAGSRSPTHSVPPVPSASAHPTQPHPRGPRASNRSPPRVPLGPDAHAVTAQSDPPTASPVSRTTTRAVPLAPGVHLSRPHGTARAARCRSPIALRGYISLRLYPSGPPDFFRRL